jgi:hypothetical protein
MGILADPPCEASQARIASARPLYGDDRSALGEAQLVPDM